MDDEVDRLVIGVRADTGQVRRELAALRGELEGPLVSGADRAGRAIEGALLRAVRSGKIGFDDLKSVALSVMAEIARAAIAGGMKSLGSSGSGAATLSSLVMAMLGAPGRATGGPVSPGRAYMVGERGPELFVPTASGRVEAAPAAGPREVRVAITVNAPAAEAPAMLRQSGRQVARAVKAALEG
jgi:hypothetical protein